MTLPNFLLIGAAKSGTSSLYNYIGQHPQIYTSPIEGSCYFAFEEGQKPVFSGLGDQGFYDRNAVTNLSAYQALFNGVTNEIAVGEGSDMYIDTPKAAERIRRIIPEVKLIAILRNPVDRAYSSFVHLRRDNREPLENFMDALMAEETRLANGNWDHLWHYKRVGFYYIHLKRYFDYFRSNQIAVYIYDDFQANPVKVLQNIYDFLGVDNYFIPNTSTIYNMGGTPKMKGLHNFLIGTNTVKTFFKSFLRAPLRARLKTMAMQWNVVADNKPEFPQETREFLAKLYRDDILKLQSLIQRDLSSWLVS